MSTPGKAGGGPATPLDHTGGMVTTRATTNLDDLDDSIEAIVERTHALAALIRQRDDRQAPEAPSPLIEVPAARPRAC